VDDDVNAPSRGSPSAPLRVLIVDDDENILNVFRAGLELHGFEVTTASSTDEAMERAGDGGETFDVIVVDINLPDGFGSSLALSLRQVHPDVKIVYMSGYTEHDPILAQGIEEHMVFLTKPFSIAELAETVRQVASG
jgi:two-component system cell cycle sensor histidine kinase/response regulator CckA